MFSISGKNGRGEFQAKFRASLPNEECIDSEIWALNTWFEEQRQTYRYRRTDELHLAVNPIQSMDDLWSNISFEVSTDLVKHWFGKTGLESQVIPIARCGGVVCAVIPCALQHAMLPGTG